MPNIAELQATVRIKGIELAEQNIKKLNASLNELNNKVRDGNKLTDEEKNKKKELVRELKQEEKALKDLEKAEKNRIKAINESNNAKKQSTGIISNFVKSLTIAGVAVNLITSAINRLKTMFVEAGREALLFQKNMALVNTVFQMSKKDINEYSKQVAGLAKNFGKAPSDLAMGLYEISQAGVNSANGMMVLEKATKASVAGFTDTQTAVKAGIGMMNAYGLTVDDLSRIYDLQFKTVERGILSYSDLNEAYGNILAPARQAGVSMEEMSGQLAFVTKQGQNSAKASVALGRAYESIFSKSDKFEKLGIAVANENGELRSTTDILGDLANKIQYLTEKAQFDILDELGFSARADRAIVAIMGNVEGVREEIALVSENAGVMDKAFAKAQDNISTEWGKLKGEVFEKVSNWVLENEKGILGLMGGIGLLISGFGALAKVIGAGLDLLAQMITLGTSEGFSDLLSKLSSIKKRTSEARIEAEKLRKSNNEMRDENRKWAEENLDQSELMKQALAKQSAYYEALGKGLQTSQNAYEAYGKNVTTVFTGIVSNSGKMAKGVATNLLEAMSILSKALPPGYVENFAGLMGKGAGEAYKRTNPKATINQVSDVTKKEYEFWKNFLSMNKKDREKEIKNLGLAVPDMVKIAIENIKLSDDPFDLKKDKKELTLDELKKDYDKQISDAKTYAKLREQTEEELNQALLSINESTLKTAIEKGWLPFGTTVSNVANALENEIELRKEIKTRTDDYNKSLEKTLDVLTDTEKETLKEGSYASKDKEKDLELIDEDIKKRTKEKNEDLNNTISETANLFGTLGDVLENDSLNALSNTINGIGSIVSLSQKMKLGIEAGGIGGLAGGLEIATAVVGVVSQLGWFDDTSGEAQSKANEDFQTAVDKFQQAVDDMSIGEKINFAQMTKPSDLGVGGVGGGGLGFDVGNLLVSPWTNALLKGAGMKEIAWGADDAKVDISAMQNKLDAGNYNIDTQAIMAKYAQREEYIDASDWFKKKTRITGYDTAGAMAEINRLIEEAYKKNLENFKTSLNLTTDSFASGMKSALEGGDIDSILTNLFDDALKTAFLNQKSFEVVYDAMGSSMTKLVLEAMGTKGKTEEELANMSLSEQMAYLKELQSTWTDVQKKAFEDAGLSLSNLTDAVDKATASTRNLPSSLKVVQLENLASKGYNVGSGSETIINVATVYGSVDSTFVNMVKKATNSTNIKRTGN